MGCNEIKDGLKVRTTKLGETKGFLIAPRHLDCRKAGIAGTVSGYVAGHGGDVWWVKHDDSAEIGAYCFTELETVATPNDPKLSDGGGWRGPCPTVERRKDEQ